MEGHGSSQIETYLSNGVTSYQDGSLSKREPDVSDVNGTGSTAVAQTRADGALSAGGENSPSGVAVGYRKRLRYDSACSQSSLGDPSSTLNSNQNVFIILPSGDDSAISVESKTKDAREADDAVAPERGPAAPERGPMAPDGGYGWVVVAGAFITNYTLGFIFAGFSVLYVDISGYFEENKSATGLIGSLILCTGNFLGFIFSPLVQRYGCRLFCLIGAFLTSLGFSISFWATSVQYLYLSCGVIAGVGNSLLMLTYVVAVQSYFTTKRATAHGIAVSGFSCGSLTSGPLLRWLLDTVGLRGTFLLLGGLFLQNCVVAALYRPLRTGKSTQHPPVSTAECASSTDAAPSTDAASSTDSAPTTGHTADGDETSQFTAASSAHQPTPVPPSGRSVALKRFLGEVFDVTLFKDPRASMMFVGCMLAQFGIMTAYAHTFGLAVHIGIPRHHAALLLTVFGAAGLCGRLLSSVLGVVVTRRALCCSLWMFALSGSVAAMTFAKGIWTLTVAGFVASVCGGVVLTIQTPVLVDLFGVERIARSQAFHNMFLGLGILISVPFGGFLFDTTGDYMLPYLANAGIQFCGGVVIFIMSFIRHKNKAQEVSSLDDSEEYHAKAI